MNSDVDSPIRTQHPSSGPELGRRIALIADRIGTRRNAYEVAGVSSATIQRYISGETAPTFDAIARLCLAAGVRMEWLATGEEPMLVADKTAPERGSQDWRLDAGTLAQAVGLVHGLLNSRDEVLEPDDFGQAVTAFYEVLSTEPKPLAGKVVEISEFIARRAKQRG